MDKDIYQTLWDIDQQGAGVRALRVTDSPPGAAQTAGYVRVDERRDNVNPELEVLAEVHIPAHKQASYDRVTALFDNFVLDQTKPEYDDPAVQQEFNTYLNYLIDTPPIQAAKEYIEQGLNRRMVRDEFWSLLQQIWFERFTTGKNPAVCGFEHVFVGEQKEGRVQGYHFWYKFHLDEHFRYKDPQRPAGEYDAIDFLNWKNIEGDDTPDSVTLSYVWRAFDYRARKFRKLTKPLGGFWVGPSAEGLIAMGTVRFLSRAGAPRRAVINGYEYNLECFTSDDGRNMRTVYPVLLGAVK